MRPQLKPVPLIALLILCLLAIAPASAAEPGPVVISSTLRVGGPSYALAVANGVAYLGQGHSLLTFDVSGQSPQALGRLRQPGLVSSITLSDGRLVVGAGDAVRIYTLGAGGAPVERTYYRAGGGVRDAVVSGDWLYVATTTGLEVVELLADGAAVLRGSLAQPNGTSQLNVEGSTIYALAPDVGNSNTSATHPSSLIKVSVANPAQPQLLDSSTGGGRTLALGAGVLFTGTDHESAFCHDCPPFTIGAYSTATLDHLGGQSWDPPANRRDDVVDLLMSGETLFALTSTLGGGCALSIFDATNPASLVRPHRHELSASACSALIIVGQQAFVALTGGGMQRFSLANLAAPIHSPPVALRGSIFQLGLAPGSLLTLSANNYQDADWTLTSYDLRDSARVQSTPLGTITRGMDITSYILDSQGPLQGVYEAATGELHLVDVSDPGAPAITAVLSLSFPGSVLSFGDLAYISTRSDQDSALIIFDMSDRSAPQEVGRMSFADLGATYQLDGELLYRMGDELAVYSLADPLNPALLGSIAVPDAAFGLAAANGVAYVPTFFGVRIVDMRNPAAPALGPLIGSANGGWVKTSDGRLAALSAESLDVYSLADPLSPALVASRAVEQFSGLLDMAGSQLALRDEAGAVVFSLLEPRVFVPLAGR
jgi:hypothetical protein